MSKERKASQTLYLVERAAFRAYNYSGLNYAQCGNDEGDSYTPVRAFSDESSAEAFRASLEAEARATLSPALFASYEIPVHLTTRIEVLGLPPLKLHAKSHDQAKEFREWWAAHATEITPEQQSAIWELFENMSIYRVSKKTLK